MVIGDTTGENHAYMVRLPCIIFFALTPVFLGIRIWNRLVRKSGLGMDDWTIIVSFLCTVIVQIMMMISCNYGFGKHISDLTTENKRSALEYFYVAQIFYKLTINLTKTSILLLYLRIFVQRWFRICCYVLMGLIIGYMIATAAATIWQCNPIRGAWDKSINPTCVSLTKNWYANAGFSIATDILILLLPMQPIWASKLPTNQKRALMVVFAMGSFVTVTSILRSTTLNFSTTSPDPTYDIASTLWTMIEENVAIICACLPMCRMLLAWLLPSIFDTAPPGTQNLGPSQNSGHGRMPSQSSSGPPWQPYTGPSKGEGVNRSIVHHGDETSEEFILFPAKDHANVGGGGSPDHDVEGAIRKTTKYEISYEHEPYEYEMAQRKA